jgi:hypothetical protein
MRGEQWTFVWAKAAEMGAVTWHAVQVGSAAAWDVAAAAAVVFGRWFARTRWARRSAVLGLGLFGLLFLIRGCRDDEVAPVALLASGSDQTAQTADGPARDASPGAVVVTFKPTLEGTDPETRVWVAQERVRAETGVFVERLLQRLPAAEAAEIGTLRRVYTTGQFLRELQRWMADGDNGDLAGAEARAELGRLRDGWRECERMIAGLARSG